jgi:hypothetical protein
VTQILQNIKLQYVIKIKEEKCRSQESEAPVFYVSSSCFSAQQSRPGRVQAQDTEFWFVAPDLYYRNASNPLDRPVYFVITAGDLLATVTMTMPAFAWNMPVRTVHVGANQSQHIIFGDDPATDVAQLLATRSCRQAMLGGNMWLYADLRPPHRRRHRRQRNRHDYRIPGKP